MGTAQALTHSIVEFYEKLSSWEHSIVRGKGLTLSQMHTLEILGIHQALPMKELAAKMGVTTGTLTVIVDRLPVGWFGANPTRRIDARSWWNSPKQGGSIFRNATGTTSNSPWISSRVSIRKRRSNSP